MFGWGRRRREREDRYLVAETVIQEDDKGQILDRLPSDDDRYRACMRWAAEARNKFYEERRLMIAATVLSTDRRYRQYSARARAVIGDQLWSRSVRSKDLASLEQMYSRWASAYKSGPESK